MKRIIVRSFIRLFWARTVATAAATNKQASKRASKRTLPIAKPASAQQSGQTNSNKKPKRKHNWSKPNAITALGSHARTRNHGCCVMLNESLCEYRVVKLHFFFFNFFSFVSLEFFFFFATAGVVVIDAFQTVYSKWIEETAKNHIFIQRAEEEKKKHITKYARARHRDKTKEMTIFYFTLKFERVCQPTNKNMKIQQAFVLRIFNQIPTDNDNSTHTHEKKKRAERMKIDGMKMCMEIRFIFGINSVVND